MNDRFLPRVFHYPKDRAKLTKRLGRIGEAGREVEEKTREIVRRVREGGISAVLAMTREFDGVKLASRDLRIGEARLKAAWDSQPAALKKALKLAAKRIEAFHRHQRREGFTVRDPLGVTMVQRVLPLQSAGIYIPGGKAAYPSTVLMNAIPAKVAGVKRIVAVTPPIRGRAENEIILAAAWLAGVHEVYQVGGAQAVAALAFGAAPIPAVDKVVGPGNIWVATAKRLLYGIIDIDMVAGPTEVLILADKSAPPAYIAADMLAQAEHDPDASAWAVLIGSYNTNELEDELLARAEASPRAEIVKASLRDNGAIVHVATREEAVELANWRAPEHLEILTAKPEKIADAIHSAGAIFVGPSTPEPIGDYVAGPNHVLPTGRTARFFSALSVDSFTRTDHVVTLTRAAFESLAAPTIELAEAEGLHAHAETIRVRLRK